MNLKISFKNDTLKSDNISIYRNSKELVYRYSNSYSNSYGIPNVSFRKMFDAMMESELTELSIEIQGLLK